MLFHIFNIVYILLTLVALGVAYILMSLIVLNVLQDIYYATAKNTDEKLELKTLEEQLQDLLFIEDEDDDFV